LNTKIVTYVKLTCAVLPSLSFDGKPGVIQTSIVQSINQSIIYLLMTVVNNSVNKTRAGEQGSDNRHWQLPYKTYVK